MTERESGIVMKKRREAAGPVVFHTANTSPIISVMVAPIVSQLDRNDPSTH